MWHTTGVTASIGGQQKTAGQVESEQEAKRAERSRVIRNNKAWKTALVVRQDWLTALLERKTLPKQAAVFVAVTLTGHAERMDSYTGLTGKLLGIDGHPLTDVDDVCIGISSAGMSARTRRIVRCIRIGGGRAGHLTSHRG